jgi:tetratricopeptide (TPR) repeat protein
MLLAACPKALAADRTTQHVIRLAALVQRADYEGDRTALHRLHADLQRYTQKRELAARVQYWRGFALWRSAINGFNDSVDPTELESDMNRAIEDFDAALAADAAYADALAGKGSCLGNLAFLHFKSGDRDRARELLMQSNAVIQQALAAAPENPRALWVLGANQAYTPPERGGGPAVAQATLDRTLQLARQQKGRVTDPLSPSWGEPELLMTLAYLDLNGKPPDLAAADRLAQEALAQVPYWHYVRDILIPRIHAAQAKPRS